MKEYTFSVIVSRSENSILESDNYSFSAVDYPTFRTEFLKRFGNLTTTNKLERQKKLVKELSYIAENIRQLIGFVNVNTNFVLSVTVKEW